MSFPFGFGQKSSLLLIFFFHGIIFSFLLLRKGLIYNNKANKWLSLLLFLCAMYIAPYMLGYAGWYMKTVTKEILFFTPFMQVLLIGPVVYFYTKSLLNSTFNLSRKDSIHFIPAILYFIYTLIVFITDKLVLDTFYFYADGRDKDLSTWYQVAGLISMSFYLILSLRYYGNYKKIVFNTVSYAESILFRWIKRFMIAFLGILILRVLFFILNPDWGEFGSQFWHYIAFSLVFYYISLNGYSNAVKMSMLNNFNNHEPVIFNEDIIEEQTIEVNATIQPLDEDTKRIKEQLIDVITNQRLFENPRLTLLDVANALDTNTKAISTVVNTGFNMNFNDFINHYRIEAVKEKLSAGEHNTTTLLGIAYDCGFNSKATFNRAFKKSTSLSPKEYLKKIA